MPRDGSTGLYTTPIGTDGIANRTISSTAYNLNVHDVETDLNTPRPIIAGGTGASTASDALKNLGAMPATGMGQCYLLKSGANLLLRPETGNLLWIKDKLETIPDAGVVLAPAGNAANTFYYIYAYMNSGVMTLEFSPTAYAVAPGTNVRIKTGDNTRTLVGIAASYPGGSSWSTYFTDVCSLFNPKLKTHSVPVSSNIATTSTTLTGISSSYDIRFCTFSDREVLFKLWGRVQNTLVTADMALDAIQDATLPYLFTNLYGTPMRVAAAVTNVWDWVYGQISYFVPENTRHMVTPFFSTTGGTMTWNGSDSVTILG